MSSTEETILSDLCTICHIQPPKYRCPRCSIRTCSLPCTRKHKKWSQCSGVRDPAAYKTRTQLESASALDQDFNFITGIERSLERAEREADRRGIELEHEYMLDPKDKRKRKRGGNAHYNNPERRLVKGELAFLRAAQAAGVKVVKAPRGLTRNKESNSKVHQKHKCLNWTVEWIIPSSGQRIVQNCLETTQLRQAYNRIFPPTNGDGEGKDQEYFYIHRQATIGTSSSSRRQTVLAPLDPSITLSDALRGRTILEFPTLYVLKKSPKEIEESKDDGFLLEEAYLREHPEETKENDEEEEEEEEDYTSSEGSSSSPSEDDSEDDEDDYSSEDENEHESENEDENTIPPPGSELDLSKVNPEKVLEVLKRDLSQPT